MEYETPLLEIAQIKLEGDGFNVVTARSESQALDLLEETPQIDAIWLDHYLLGREDAIDFVIKIKGRKEWKNIPVFVISNSASEQTKQTYLRLGVARYYIKADYGLNEIVKDIRKVVGI